MIYDNTSLLLHMNGADGANAFIDELDHPITAVYDAKTKSIIKKFGVSSAYFDGSSDCLRVPLGDDLKFGTGDFTIDFWYYPEIQSQSYPIIFANTVSLLDPGQFLFYCGGLAQGGNTSTKYFFRFIDNGYSTKWITSISDIIINTWVHIAIVRFGTSILLFINGILESTLTIVSTLTMNGDAPYFAIGCDPPLTTACSIKGYIDEFRISKGVARWKTNFTPPIEPYPVFTQIQTKVTYDKNTVLLLHMDGINNSSVFKDEVGHIPKSVISSIVISDTNKKFGSSSAKLNGQTGSVDFEDLNYIFKVGTLDFWLWLNQVNCQRTGYGCMPFSSGDSSSSAYCQYYNGQLRVFSAGTTEIGTFGNIELNKWNHLEVTVDGSYCYCFVNGINTSKVAYAENLFTNPIIRIGGFSNDYTPDGFIDELRITNGIPRHTKNFTTETSQYEINYVIKSSKIHKISSLKKYTL